MKNKPSYSAYKKSERFTENAYTALKNAERDNRKGRGRQFRKE